MRWTPKERRIFKWHDGSRPRASDPLAIERRLGQALGANWIRLLKPILMADTLASVAEKIEEESAQIPAADAKHHALLTIEELAAGVRQAFGVAAPAETEIAGEVVLVGFTEAECLDLLAAFVTFMRGLEDEARPFVTGSGPAPPLPLETVPATDNSAALCSQADKPPSFVMPPPSLSEWDL